MIKCALVVGHKETSPGAVNDFHEISEFSFNTEVAKLVQSRNSGRLVYVDVVYRNLYKDLPDKINILNPDFIVSLHCNAFNREVNGTETLYYRKSEKGGQIAEVFQKHMLKCFNFPDRGTKPTSSEDRGGYLLKYTHAPCIIVEPFFIDNDSAIETAFNKIDDYADALINAMEEVAEADIILT